MKYDEAKHYEKFMGGIREHHSTPRMVDRMKREHGVAPPHAMPGALPHKLSMPAPMSAKSEPVSNPHASGEAPPDDGMEQYPEGHPHGCMCEECKGIRGGGMKPHGEFSDDEMSELEKGLGG